MFERKRLTPIKWYLMKWVPTLSVVHLHCTCAVVRRYEYNITNVTDENHAIFCDAILVAEFFQLSIQGLFSNYLEPISSNFDGVVTVIFARVEEVFGDHQSFISVRCK